VDEGEMSAFGLPGVTGVLVTEITPGSALAVGGLIPNDVILAVNDREVKSVAGLKGLAGNLNVRVSRNQKFLQLRIMPL
jgi:S1-C subfamily serine protease